MSAGQPIMDVVVLGGGEHGRVVMEAVRSRADRFRLIGFCDGVPCDDTVARLGVPRLGDDGEALARLRDGARLVIGVGEIGPAERRRAIAERFPSEAFVAVVHAEASVSPTARVAAGAVVFARAVVGTGATVGRHAIVNHAAVVEHDVTLDPFVHVGPAAAIGGGTHIGAGTYIGLGARVRDHVVVGAGVLVGMGAAVVRDVPDGARLVGVPARSLAR
jgi:sugar O-acyltransferase (sialic acid O-acetyltransferase NeuD family)